MIAFVDYRITTEEVTVLKKLNFDVIKVPQDKNLYSSIDGHVDIQVNILDRKNSKIIINKNLPNYFKKVLTQNNINYIEGTSTLLNAYPENIALNAYITENYIIHNLKYTDEQILDYCGDKNHINIKQGYAKCSILPLKENVIITNDPGINKVLSKYEFDILLLPYGDILLPGLDYGFIGGTGGMINEKTMAFFGSLDCYKYGNEVKDFLKKHGIIPIYLSHGKLNDRGSLLVL